MSDKKAGRPEKDKTAYVTYGRSVLTILGTAHAGAKITSKMLSKKETQGTSSQKNGA